MSELLSQTSLLINDTTTHIYKFAWLLLSNLCNTSDGLICSTYYGMRGKKLRIYNLNNSEPVTDNYCSTVIFIVHNIPFWTWKWENKVAVFKLIHYIHIHCGLLLQNPACSRDIKAVIGIDTLIKAPGTQWCFEEKLCFLFLSALPELWWLFCKMYSCVSPSFTLFNILHCLLNATG